MAEDRVIGQFACWYDGPQLPGAAREAGRKVESTPGLPGRFACLTSEPAL